MNIYEYEKKVKVQFSRTKLHYFLPFDDLIMHKCRAFGKSCTNSTYGLLCYIQKNADLRKLLKFNTHDRC